MKKLITLLLSSALALTLTACSTLSDSSNEGESPEVAYENISEKFHNDLAIVVGDSDWRQGSPKVIPCDLDSNLSMVTLESSGINSKQPANTTIMIIHDMLLESGYAVKPPTLDILDQDPQAQFLMLEGAQESGLGFKITIDKFDTIIAESSTNCF